jgi:isocitrate dehydrogenase
MSNMINVTKPLVVLHGDEMAQIAFEKILQQFVTSKLNIELIEIDLTAENRLITNGEAVTDAIAALKTHGVGVKNAGMTVNRQQLYELLPKHPNIK